MSTRISYKGNQISGGGGAKKECKITLSYDRDFHTYSVDKTPQDIENALSDGADLIVYYDNYDNYIILYPVIIASPDYMFSNQYTDSTPVGSGIFTLQLIKDTDTVWETCELYNIDGTGFRREIRSGIDLFTENAIQLNDFDHEDDGEYDIITPHKLTSAEIDDIIDTEATLETSQITAQNFKNFYNSTTIQKTELPTPSIDEVGKIYQYIGNDSTYTNGNFYKCIETSGNYSWIVVDFGGGAAIENVETLPTANIENKFYRDVSEQTIDLVFHENDTSLEYFQDQLKKIGFITDGILIDQGDWKYYDYTPTYEVRYEFTSGKTRVRHAQLYTKFSGAEQVALILYGLVDNVNVAIFSGKPETQQLTIYYNDNKLYAGNAAEQLLDRVALISDINGKAAGDAVVYSDTKPKAHSESNEYANGSVVCYTGTEDSFFRDGHLYKASLGERNTLKVWHGYKPGDTSMWNFWTADDVTDIEVGTVIYRQCSVMISGATISVIAMAWTVTSVTGNSITATRIYNDEADVDSSITYNDITSEGQIITIAPIYDFVDITAVSADSEDVTIIEDVATLPIGANIEDHLYRTKLNKIISSVDVALDGSMGMSDMINVFATALPTWTQNSYKFNPPAGEFWTHTQFPNNYIIQIQCISIYNISIQHKPIDSTDSETYTTIYDPSTTTFTTSINKIERVLSIYAGNSTEQQNDRLAMHSDILDEATPHFIGTKAEWNALTAQEKEKYDGEIVNITDDDASGVSEEYIRVIADDEANKLLNAQSGTTDCNTTLKAGVYSCAPQTANKPTGVDYGVLMVFGQRTEFASPSVQWIYQFFYETAGRIYRRYCINPNSLTPNTWSAWEIIAGGVEQISNPFTVNTEKVNSVDEIMAIKQGQMVQFKVYLDELKNITEGNWITLGTVSNDIKPAMETPLTISDGTTVSRTALARIIPTGEVQIWGNQSLNTMSSRFSATYFSAN